MNPTEMTFFDEKWKHLLLIHQFGVNEIETKLGILNDEYEFLHDYNPIDRISSRIKDPREIVNKLLRMGLEPNASNAYKHLRDIGGVRVTCSFSKDVYSIASLLRHQADIKVIDVKDYIKNPKANGYRSLHMIVETPIYLSSTVMPVVVEVQFRSVSMDLWAGIEHKIYYKSAVNIPESLSRRLGACADKLDELDKELYQIKQEIDQYTDKTMVAAVSSPARS